MLQKEKSCGVFRFLVYVHVFVRTYLCFVYWGDLQGKGPLVTTSGASSPSHLLFLLHYTLKFTSLTQFHRPYRAHCCFLFPRQQCSLRVLLFIKCAKGDLGSYATSLSTTDMHSRHSQILFRVLYIV